MSRTFGVLKATRECVANLECRIADTRPVATCGLFVLEVIQAWIDPAVKDPKTIHHLGREDFMVAGKRIKPRSRAK